MNRHVRTILLSVAAAVLSGVIFVIAVFHQFGLVEAAASLLTGLQVFRKPQGKRCCCRMKKSFAAVWSACTS
jgi:hypothetical protein